MDLILLAHLALTPFPPFFAFSSFPPAHISSCLVRECQRPGGGARGKARGLRKVIRAPENRERYRPLQYTPKCNTLYLPLCLLGGICEREVGGASQSGARLSGGRYYMYGEERKRRLIFGRYGGCQRNKCRRRSAVEASSTRPRPACANLLLKLISSRSRKTHSARS